MEDASRDFRRVGFGLGVVVLLVSLAVVFWTMRLRSENRKQRPANERGASTMLRVIAMAEEEFRNGDRDGNGVQDYWTRDVAGLSRFNNRVPDDVASADGARDGSKPRNGYYYKALDSDRSPTKFAFCAYPADYDRSGKWTFVINEKRQFYRVDTGGKAIGRWAPDPSTWIPME